MFGLTEKVFDCKFVQQIFGTKTNSRLGLNTPQLTSFNLIKCFFVRTLKFAYSWSFGCGSLLCWEPVPTVSKQSIIVNQYRNMYVCFQRSLSVPTILLNLQVLSSNCSRYRLLLFLIELIHKCFLELFANWRSTKILKDILPRYERN